MDIEKIKVLKDMFNAELNTILDACPVTETKTLLKIRKSRKQVKSLADVLLAALNEITITDHPTVVIEKKKA